MAPVTPPSKILVSGASGFIAAWVVKAILDKGYHVIGSVRSPSKGDYLQKLFGDKFSYTVVEDIAKPGAFDEAIKLGVDGVVHTATPANVGPYLDPARMIAPSISGTTSLLDSITKYGPNVKRVVLTSSIVSCLEPKEGQYIYTESDWNETSPAIVEKEGPRAGPHVYRAGKVLAERAAWEHAKKHDSFDLVAILPSTVFGPIIHEVKDLISLNTTSSIFWTNVTEPSDPKRGRFTSHNFVDVRDVALAHAIALESPVAGGERFIVSNSPFQFQDHKDILRAAGFTEVPEGIPGSGKTKVPLVIGDGSKAARMLGFKYRSAEEMVVDGYKSLKERFVKEAQL